MLLQEKNGTDMGQQHKGYHGVHIYTSLIAGSQLQQTTARLKQARLFGFLSDGTPGKHDHAEHESVYVRCFDAESGKPVMSMAGLNELEHQHAEGLVCALKLSC